MSDSVPVCSIDPALRERLRQFRFRREKTPQAIVMKIDRERQVLLCDEVLDDVTASLFRKKYSFFKFQK